MPMIKDDRVAFSLKIVSADAEVKGLEVAKVALVKQQSIIQKLDTANKNLFDPSNALVNAYQAELAVLTGVVCSITLEQDILDAAAKKIQNHYFPNDLSTVVPSLTSLRNVWPRVQPFALTYAIGKNYVEVYPGSTQKESDLITSILTLISSASAFTDIEKTSGQKVASAGGTCSILTYTTQSTCEAATPTPGVWTPGIATIVTYPEVQTLANNLTSAVNALKSFLTSEALLIPIDLTQQTYNDAARNNINNVILPALNTWLAYLDTMNVPGTTSAIQFPTYDSNLLAPTKLHSAQLAALQAALNSRSTFQSTRINQIAAVLGNITQDINTGEIASKSGLYGKRYGFLLLRLNALGGSLTQLNSLQIASGAQDSIKANTIATKATYFGILPTSLFKANASGSTIIHVVDPSFLTVGDQVFIYAETQEELIRGVKAISGDMVTLSDSVPAKYTTSIKTRIYKDLT